MRRIWRKVVHFQYEISNDGQVRREGTADIIRRSKTPSGQPRVRLYKNGVGHWRTIQALINEAFDRKLLVPMDIPAEDWHTLEGQDLRIIDHGEMFDQYPNCSKPYEMVAEILQVSVPIIYRLKHGGREWKKIWRQHHPIP